MKQPSHPQWSQPTPAIQQFYVFQRERENEKKDMKKI